MHLHVKQLLTENELKTGIRILTKPKMQEKSHENQVGPEKDIGSGPGSWKES